MFINETMQSQYSNWRWTTAFQCSGTRLTCRATSSYTERDDGHCTAGWCSTYMCAAGVTDGSGWGGYIRNVLWAVLVCSADGQIHTFIRFRTKVQGEHEFARDIKVETWTQIKLYCWKCCTSTWNLFALCHPHDCCMSQLQQTDSRAEG